MEPRSLRRDCAGHARMKGAVISERSRGAEGMRETAASSDVPAAEQTRCVAGDGMGIAVLIEPGYRRARSHGFGGGIEGIVLHPNFIGSGASRSRRAGAAVGIILAAAGYYGQQQNREQQDGKPLHILRNW